MFKTTIITLLKLFCKSNFPISWNKGELFLYISLIAISLIEDINLFSKFVSMLSILFFIDYIAISVRTLAVIFSGLDFALNKYAMHASIQTPNGFF